MVELSSIHSVRSEVETLDDGGIMPPSSFHRRSRSSGEKIVTCNGGSQLAMLALPLLQRQPSQSRQKNQRYGSYTQLHLKQSTAETWLAPFSRWSPLEPKWLMRCYTGGLPTFIETPSSELNDLLATVRSRIFIPSHLSIPQQRLIYRARNHAMLRNDPFYVDIGGESVQLQPIDRTKDVPDSWKSVMRAVDLLSGAVTSNSKDNRLWDNLVAVLAGMRTAGRRWKAWQWERIVRQVGQAGAAHIVLAAVQQAEKTGLYLHDIRVVREVFWAFRTKAAQADWNLEHTDKALRYVRQVAALLDDKNHSAKREADMPDPRYEADLIGVLLELLAVRVENHLEKESPEEQEELEKLRSYVERLMSNLDQSQIGRTGNNRVFRAAEADYELLRGAPVYNGLRISQKILEGRMPQGDAVKKAIRELDEKLREAAEVVKADEPKDLEKRGGLKWFQALTQL